MKEQLQRLKFKYDWGKVDSRSAYLPISNLIFNKLYSSFRTKFPSNPTNVLLFSTTCSLMSWNLIHPAFNWPASILSRHTLIDFVTSHSLKMCYLKIGIERGWTVHFSSVHLSIDVYFKSFCSANLECLFCIMWLNWLRIYIHSNKKHVLCHKVFQTLL